MTHFQKWIFHKMVQANISQAQLAKKSGLSYFTINQWINTVKRPQTRSLSKVVKVLADELGQSYDVLLQEVMDELAR